jgi:hypothetical protein
MKRLMLGLCVMAAACGGSSKSGNDGPGGGGGADMALGGSFQTFTPATRGVNGSDGDLVLSSTDAQGVIGCSLADPSASPGVATSRVSFRVKRDDGPTPTCETGTVAIGQHGSAMFERWNAAGQKTDVVSAVGGALSFASSSAGVDTNRCDVTFTLSFPGGGGFTDSFSYNFDRYGAIADNCIKGEACQCEAWQSCGADHQCVDLACVPASGTCPADGSVPCCAGTGSCNGGRCCVNDAVTCDPASNNCCYGCNFLNNQIYHGWYCTHP